MFRVNNMEMIKNYIFSLCGASIVVSVAKMILHNSKFTKTVNIFLSLFLLFYMVAPFGNKNADMSFYEPKSSKNTEDYSDSYSELIDFTVKKVCRDENCNAEKIAVHLKEKDGENVVDFIEIEVDDKSKAEKISEKLKNEYGFEVKVS